MGNYMFHPKGRPMPKEPSIGQLARQSAELAACLRGAVTAMEVLRDIYENPVRDFPGLLDLIKRSEAALKDYEK